MGLAVGAGGGLEASILCPVDLTIGPLKCPHNMVTPMERVIQEEAKQGPRCLFCPGLVRHTLCPIGTAGQLCSVREGAPQRREYWKTRILEGHCEAGYPWNLISASLQRIVRF